MRRWALQPLHVPNCCRKPRSRIARRSPSQGSPFEFSSCKDGSSGTTTDSMDQDSDFPFSRHREEVPELSLVQCSMSWNRRHEEVIFNPVEVPIIEVESFTQNALPMSCNKGKRELHSYDRVSTHSNAGPLPFTLDNSILQVEGSNDAWLAPGNVVWAKTAYHEWWPAEVMDERAVPECTSSQSVGHILVQLYGSHEYAWLDPVGDLSEFDHCYEERRKNPLIAFQDALKQALFKKEHTSSGIVSDRSYDELKCSVQQDDQSYDKSNILSSRRTKDDYIEEGRGKRQRKLKIHFDELTIPEKSIRKVRRLRIMRYLGLAAPAGSPFSLSRVRTVESRAAAESEQAPTATIQKRRFQPPEK